MIKNYTNTKKLIAGLSVVASLLGATNLHAQLITQTYSFTGTINTYTGVIQTFTVPACVTTMTIETRGASGGFNSGGTGGAGARMIGVFTTTPGQKLFLLVGKSPGSVTSEGYTFPGGGGGSYVGTGTTYSTALPMIVAGGGGGGMSTTGDAAPATTSGTGVNPGTAGNGAPASSCGGGGGGFFTSGGNDLNYGFLGGLGFQQGGTGGTASATYLTSGYQPGGFGGAAAANYVGSCNIQAGAGGGYSGGSGYGTALYYIGAAGGSYNSGTSQSNTGGFQTGHGLIILTYSATPYVTAAISSSAICTGGTTTLSANSVSTYTWSNGATTSNIVVSPGTTTNYTVQGTNTSGCITQSVLTVTVNSGVPVLSIASSTNNLCLGKTATVTASGALTYTWTNGITNGSSFLPTAGVNNYTVSGQNGCGITNAVATITVAPLPVTVLSSPTVVCSGSTATLTAAAAVTGFTWQPIGLVGNNVIVGPVSTSVFTVTASDGTCSGTATLALAVNPIPTIALVASSTLVCEGAPVTLTASGALSYSWTSPANTIGAVITVNPSGPTSYQVFGTNSFGCSASQSQIVLTNSSPTVNITTNKTIACPGDAVNLLAGGSGATSYAWTNGPSTAAYNVNPAFTTAYVVTGTGLGCTTSKTITIAVVNASVSAVTSNTGICNGGSATLTASGANSYLWVGFVPGASAIVTPTASTVYTVNAVTTASAISCPSSANINITVYSNPTISIAATKTVMCKPDSGPKLTASGAVTYTWSNNATTSTVNVAPTITASTYTVTGTDANGCVNSSVITIKVNTCTGINGIAVNDKALVVYPNPSNGEFTITGDSDITLKIVNELGQEVSNIKLSAQNDHKVSISNLANGIYFIIGQNENGAVNQKIIVSN